MSTAGPLTTNRPERVAVVIPAKNEEQRIEATIASARSIAGADLVVVVDDGSSDATAAVAMGAEAIVVRHKSNRGKAAAMATGAQMVEMREDADRADGGADFVEELHAEPREPGHTGPLPVIGDAGAVPRALLFLDADMGDSAAAAQPLVDAVLNEGVDMAIALLPPQDGAAGMGMVVRTARSGIQRATGWQPSQPLSGTRCITREAWEVCQPLAAGWGVETSLTIDALTAGFWVKEIEAELHHRATGRDLRGQLHRAAQLRDVLRALARRRHLAPEIAEDQIEQEGQGTDQTVPTAPGTQSVASPAAPPTPAPLRASPLAPGPAPGDPGGPGDTEATGDATGLATASEETASPADAVAPESAVTSSGDAWADDDGATWTVAEDDPAARAARRREQLLLLPVDNSFSDDQTRQLGDVDVDELNLALRRLPVAGAFAPDDVVFLAGTDLAALAEKLGAAPVDGPFSTEHAVIIASHLSTTPAPELPPSVELPLSADEYTSLVVHAAVEAGNSD